MGLDPTPQNVHKLEPFLCPIDKASGSTAVNKTGLGSSAALVTSLVGGLLEFFGVVSLPSFSNGFKEEMNESDGLRLSHNLAQICHCYAQGKVGSGFDVSSAVYGSHVYTRFSKDVIHPLLEEVDKLNADDNETLHMSGPLVNNLFELVNDTSKIWDCTVAPFSLPPGLDIIMADVCGGSESPSMAKKVMEWKRSSRKVGFMDDYFWKNLKRCNKKIASLLTKDFASIPVIGGLDRDGAQILANRTAEQWKKPMPSSWHEFEGSSWYVAGKLLDLRIALLESRQNLKGMGIAAGVPIEPDEQTKLADATMKLPGVIAAGVPGAGGNDALFVLYVKGTETANGRSDIVRDRIGYLWKQLGEIDNETVVCPLSAGAAGYGGENGLSVTSLNW
jgi:phosphomevalonate kinase